MRSIGIIGLGHTGILLANLLVAQGAVDQLVLIDQDDQRTNAVAADLADALPASQPQIIQQDYMALKNTDIIIIAAGDASKLSTGRFAELSANAAMIRRLAKQIQQSGFSGVLLNLSNPNEATTALWQQELAWPTRRVIGTGTLLDTQRAKVAVARQAHLHPTAVEGFIIGQHDGRLVFPWSTWNVNGQPMPAAINGHSLDQHQLAIKSRESSWLTVNGLGYDATGICFAALRVIKAVMSDSGKILPIAVYHPQFKTYLSYPVAVGRQGSGIFNLLKLLPVEEEQLTVAATSISDQVASQR